MSLSKLIDKAFEEIKEIALTLSTLGSTEGKLVNPQFRVHTISEDLVGLRA